MLRQGFYHEDRFCPSIGNGPCKGRTVNAKNPNNFCNVFRSAHPEGGVTQNRYQRPRVKRISTHALRKECDRREQDRSESVYYFDPRAPCGARLTYNGSAQSPTWFQPTRPFGARPPYPAARWHAMAVSIHAPLIARDRKELYSFVSGCASANRIRR